MDRGWLGGGAWLRGAGLTYMGTPDGLFLIKRPLPGEYLRGRGDVSGRRYIILKAFSGEYGKCLVIRQRYTWGSSFGKERGLVSTNSHSLFSRSVLTPKGKRQYTSILDSLLPSQMCIDLSPLGDRYTIFAPPQQGYALFNQRMVGYSLSKYSITVQPK